MLLLASKARWSLLYPMNWSPPGSSIYGISQARILERVAISFSRVSFPTQRWNLSLALAGRFFTSEPPE